MTTKTCARCNQQKPLSEFYSDNRSRGRLPPRGGYGVQAECKRCHAERRKPEIWTERECRAELASRGLKLCSVCGVIKPTSEYNKRRASRLDGLCYKCRDCALSYGKKWREDRPEAYALWASANVERLQALGRRWRGENAQYNKERYAKWAKENPAKVRAIEARRIAAKFHATPAWADHGAIEAIYAEAVRLTRETGERHEVDHFYPLQGKSVCGLHWEANLQILTKTENVRKLNRMPEELGSAPAGCQMIMGSEDGPWRSSRNDEGSGSGNP